MECCGYSKCEAPGLVGNTKRKKLATKRHGAITRVIEKDHRKTHIWGFVPMLPEMRKVRHVHTILDKPRDNQGIVVIGQSHFFTGMPQKTGEVCSLCMKK